MSTQVIALNLQRIRSAKGVPQAELAERAGLSRAGYQKIEKGEVTPRFLTLERLADALGVRLQDLVTPVKPLTQIRFRALRQLRSREHVLAEVSRWLDDYNSLEEAIGVRQDYQLGELAVDMSTEQVLSLGDQRPIEAARRARHLMKIGDEPVRDICGLLESNGVKVYPMELASSLFFGLSVGAADGGPAVVVNTWDRISVERWIFTTAHEFGHLILHLDSYDVSQSVEDLEQECEANAFASEFLMPKKTFDDEWAETEGHLFIDRVFKVKRIFRVSWRTVLYRLCKTVDPNAWERFQTQYKGRYHRSLSATDEPLGVPPEMFRAPTSYNPYDLEPVRLSEWDFMEDRLSLLVLMAIKKEAITVSRGAEILGLEYEKMLERVESWAE